MTDSVNYDVFVSYARKDDAGGWVSGLRDAIYDDFRAFSSEPFRIFFDQTEIHSRQDWELRLRRGLRSSRVLLVCLSPNYLRSDYCQWEWEEFSRLQARRIGGGDAVTGVYFVELGGDDQYDEQITAWRREVERLQLEQLQPWFPEGVKALQEAEVRQRVKALGLGVQEALSEARLAKQAPGNLRRHNPWFVGRVAELRALRHQLTGGAVGVVTAVHGIGGMGKTELAVTYARACAQDYQGGTWQVDADGQTDMLELVSTLAMFPDVGVQVGERDLRDRSWLGRRVLARLAELTAAARAEDPATAACLLLLDNVSEPELLSESQLAVLPDEPWLHLLVTTRLGVSDVGAAGSRASVAMVEVGRLAAEDGLTLIREHQFARDAARLDPDFSSPVEEDAARQVVEMLDGYTLAIEQAAVYLGVTGEAPSSLLADLQAQGVAALDQTTEGDQPGSVADTAAAIRGQIRHQERLAGRIVDQTVQRLPPRARAALGPACLLPPDGIPWEWLRELTQSTDTTPRTGLAGLSGGDDWPATRRVLEGRRLLTVADDPRFARLHRVLGAHLRQQLTDPDTVQNLDALLGRGSEDLQHTSIDMFDTALLAVTATAVTGRLTDNPHELPNPDLANAALGLIQTVGSNIDVADADILASAVLDAYERLTAADPYNTSWQHDLAKSLVELGWHREVWDDTHGALLHATRALNIRERLAEFDKENFDQQREFASSLDSVGRLLEAHGDMPGALVRARRALQICERLADADPNNPKQHEALSEAICWVADLLVRRGDTRRALDYYTRHLQCWERLAEADPDDPEWQRFLSLRLDWVGKMLARGGDIDGALAHCTRALDMCERLVEGDPDNPEWQRLLSLRLDQVGKVLARGGDIDGALAHCTRALRIAQRLIESDPDDPEWQRRQVVSLFNVVSLLESAGDASAAKDHFTSVLEAPGKLPDRDQRLLEYAAAKVGLLLGSAPVWDKTVKPWASWEPCGDEQGRAALEQLEWDLPRWLNLLNLTLVSCRWSLLPFYKAHHLIELTFVGEYGMERAFVLDGPRGTVRLDGKSKPIHATNNAESLALTESTVADYLRFFFYFIRSYGRAFVLIESSDEIERTDAVGDPDDYQGEILTLEAARRKARPLLVRGLDAGGRWLIDVTIAYDGRLSAASIAVGPDGDADMIDDEPIGALGALTVPQVPFLDLGAQA